MKLLRKNLSTASGWLLLVAVGLCCSDRTYSQVKSPEQADPARWTQEDVTTEQQYVTARKELAAAYQISLTECAPLVAIDKQLCLNDAKRAYEQELSLLGFRLGPAR